MCGIAKPKLEVSSFSMQLLCSLPQFFIRQHTAKLLKSNPDLKNEICKTVPSKVFRHGKWISLLRFYSPPVSDSVVHINYMLHPSIDFRLFPIIWHNVKTNLLLGHRCSEVLFLSWRKALGYEISKKGFHVSLEHKRAYSFGPTQYTSYHLHCLQLTEILPVCGNT